MKFNPCIKCRAVDSVGLALCLLIVGNSFSSTFAQVPGTSRTLEFGSDGKPPIPMPFVYCSPPVGAINAKPYLIATTELSFEALKEISPEVYKQLIDRWSKFKGQYTDIRKMCDDPTAYPAIGLELPEVAEVVHQLNARASGNPLSEDLLSSLVLRIPTELEWEHAMRSGRPVDELKYFNVWRSFESLTDKERGPIQELWNTKFPGVEFRGTQEDVAKLIEKYGGPADAENYRLVFDHFLKDLGRSNWADTDSLDSSRLIPDGSLVSTKSSWGVQGAHRGYPEWVLMVANQNEANGSWQDFQKQPSNSTLQVSIAGARRSSALRGTDVSEFWSGIILSGGPRSTGVNRIGKTATETRAEDWAMSYDTGMRIVALETLRPDWFVFVRGTAISDDSAEARLTNLNQYQPAIEKLSPQPKRDLSVLGFYKALVTYQAKNTVEASRILRDIAVANGDGGRQSARALLESLGNQAQDSSKASAPRRNSMQVYLDSLASLMDAEGSLN